MDNPPKCHTSARTTAEVQQQPSVRFLPGPPRAFSRQKGTRSDCKLSELRSRQVMFPSGGWTISHSNLAHKGRQLLGKLGSPSSPSQGKARPWHSHRPLTSSMLEMPRSLMSTSGWFFSRLSSTNFFRDLDMICTKRQQQRTWVKAGGCRRRKERTLLGTLGFPRALESGQGTGASWRMGRGGEGERVQHPSNRAEASKAKCNATHTHLRGQHLTGGNVDAAGSRRARFAGERCTPPKLQRYPNRERSRADALRRRIGAAPPRPALDPSQIRRTVYYVWPAGEASPKEERVSPLNRPITSVFRPEDPAPPRDWSFHLEFGFGDSDWAGGGACALVLAQAQLGGSAADESGEAQEATECWVPGKREGTLFSGPASVAVNPPIRSCHRESPAPECAPRHMMSSSKTKCLVVCVPSAQPGTPVSQEEGNTKINK